MAKIIGVDFDDVLVAFNDALCPWHNAKYGTSYTIEDLALHELNSAWSCTEEEALIRVRQFLLSPEHEDMLAVEGAVEALNIFGEENCHIITARALSFKEATAKLLGKHFPKMIDRIHYVGTEHGFIHHEQIKPAACMRLGVDVFIDDSLVHANGVSKAGIPVLLLDNPWNQTECLPPNVERVYSWSEIVERLKG